MTRVPVNTFLEVFSQGAWCFTDQHHKISTILFPDYQWHPNITASSAVTNCQTCTKEMSLCLDVVASPLTDSCLLKM